MSSFFTTPASQKKRKRQEQDSSNSSKRRNVPTTTTTQTRNRPSSKNRKRSESISGSDSDGERPVENGGWASDSTDAEEQNESAAEKRLRLAEQYLQNIRQEVDEAGFDAAEIDKDLIAERLKEDVAETKGKVYRYIAQGLGFEDTVQTFFRADQLDITAIACCPPYVYTVANDMSVVKWELPSSVDPSEAEGRLANGTGHTRSNYTLARRPKRIAYARGRRSRRSAYLGHTSQILCVAASTTGRFIVTGGLDRRLVVWDVSSPNTLKAVKVFTHHRDAVTGLAFRSGTNQLYSCSRDRTVKVWSLDELAYVETLFGHQDSVVGVASSGKEVCLSVGSRDRTARLWKVGEETQLVFRGGGIPGKSKASRDEISKAKTLGRGTTERDLSTSEAQYAEGSIDVISLIDDETFVTGADNGSISLWNIHKKKPVATVPLAHGLDPPMALEDTFAEQNLSERQDKKAPAPPGPRWITALTTIPYSNIVLSGSWDGTIMCWMLSEDKRSLHNVGVVGKTSHNGALSKQVPNDDMNAHQMRPTKSIAGVVNGIIAFEKGDRGKDGITVCAAIGKDHRLGRWRSFAKRSTAVKFDIPRKHIDSLTNGLGLHGDVDEDT